MGCGLSWTVGCGPGAVLATPVGTNTLRAGFPRAAARLMYAPTMSRMIGAARISHLVIQSREKNSCHVEADSLRFTAHPYSPA